MPTLARALKEFLLDIRPAQNMLVLKTPPGGAQPLAAAVDAEHWKEVAGTLAGDDTVLIISPSRSASQRRSEARGGNAPMNDPARVAVVGATGYAGFELARLLLRHPHIETTDILSARGPRERSLPDGALSAASRLGRSAVQAAFGRGRREERRGGGVSFDAARGFARTRAGIARGESGLRIVDLSGAFRFREPETFAKWYKLAAAGRRDSGEAVYGLPELYGDALPKARLVANPGCYPTSVILGLRPLVDAGWIDTSRGIVCDCKSGVSGAGKEPKRETHFVEVNENFRAYGLFTHRHTPEVTEHLGLASEDFVFTTHLLPVERGILSTLYVWLDSARKAEEVESLYRKFYTGHPMVRVLPAGQLAGVAARGAHEFLRHRLRARCFGRAAGDRFVSRQSGQGRGGTSGAKLQRDARVSGNGGVAMRMVDQDCRSAAGAR